MTWKEIDLLYSKSTVGSGDIADSYIKLQYVFHLGGVTSSNFSLHNQKTDIFLLATINHGSLADCVNFAASV